MSDDSDNDVDRQYQDFERKTVDAFNHWHAFHEDLQKLGDFATWLSDSENQVDLVTFFALDKGNTESFDKALAHQSEFLAALQQLVEMTHKMFLEYGNRGENGEDSGEDNGEDEAG